MKQILLFSLIFMSAVACQKGKKVESLATNYEESMKIRETLNEELKKDGINLNSHRDLRKLESKANDLPHLPQAARRDDNIDRVTGNLVDFVVVSTKILQLADEKVVVFSEKSKIQNELKLAAHYLAEIYADKNLDNGAPFIAREVDEAELNIRFLRQHKNLKFLEKIGLPTGASNQKNIKDIKKIRVQDLKKAIASCEMLSDDWMRMRTLSNRNNHFDMTGMKALADGAEGIAGYYYQLGVAIQAEFERRGVR